MDIKIKFQILILVFEKTKISDFLFCIMIIRYDLRRQFMIILISNNGIACWEG